MQHLSTFTTRESQAYEHSTLVLTRLATFPFRVRTTAGDQTDENAGDEEAGWNLEAQRHGRQHKGEEGKHSQRGNAVDKARVVEQSLDRVLVGAENQ